MNVFLRKYKKNWARKFNFAKYKKKFFWRGNIKKKFGVDYYFFFRASGFSVSDSPIYNYRIYF